MSDETVRPEEWSGTEPEAQEAAEKRVGFCQDCGKPLTRETVRTVGSGVFCEPCLEARVGTPAGQAAYSSASGASAAAGAAPSAGYPGARTSGYGPAPTNSDEPSPGLAFVLGLIPGVGAMYNGQFAKGVVHFVIFAVLVSLSKDVSGIFGLFVMGWIFYMAFEAQHTAKARLEGLPLPNAFGFNDIGERMGFGKTWGAVPTGRSGMGDPIVGGGPTPAGYPASAAGAGAAASSVPAGTVPVGTGPDWVGYVPPTAFASAPPVAAAYPAGGYPAAGYQATGYQAAYPVAGYAATGYGATGYAAGGYAAGGYPGPAAQGVPAQPVAPPYAAPHSVPYVDTHTGIPIVPSGMPPSRRFPTGALWLIGLGVLILGANLFPEWRMSERWLVPILFAGLSLWTLTRRLRSGQSLACLLRWPLILMVLAVLFGLQAAYVATLGQTWPVLFIALGAVLLLERMAGPGTPFMPPAAATTTGFGGSGYTSVVPAADPVTMPAPEADELRTRAAWTAPESDSTKGGQ